MTSITASTDASVWTPTFAVVGAWCERCHRTIPVMYTIRRCDSCIDREISLLKKGSKQNTSFVEGG